MDGLMQEKGKSFANALEPEPWFNIKIPLHQYRKCLCEDKMVVRSSYLHNGISYTGMMVS